MADQTADVVIVGGAVMGSSVACHLAMRDDFSGRIVVIEADPAYETCASARSAASIRQQFSSAINIEISLYGIRFLREIGAALNVNGDRPAIDPPGGQRAAPAPVPAPAQAQPMNYHLGAPPGGFSRPGPQQSYNPNANQPQQNYYLRY